MSSDYPIVPVDGDNRFPLRVAFPAPEPGREVNDPIIRAKPQPVGETAGGDQLVMAAGTLDDHEISGTEVADESRIQRHHRWITRSLSVRTEKRWTGRFVKGVGAIARGAITRLCRGI